MKINKSEVMKRAWQLFKSGDITFSYALKAAWVQIKKETEERYSKARKRDIFSKLKIHKVTKQAKVAICGRTYPCKDELRAEGFEWVPGKEVWIKVFKNQKAAEKFLVTFNCTRV